MTIRLYAGSLRPGGGLTVAKVMIEALAEMRSEQIIVYTGASDASAALRQVFEQHANVVERPFFPGLNAELRYALSKLFFVPVTWFDRTSVLLSFNYFVPCLCRQFVYHINLLSFQKTDRESTGKRIKEIDAALACRLATMNVFESDYLVSMARQYTGRPIRNPKRLYTGIDPAFYRDPAATAAGGQGDPASAQRIMVVSSIQPHKDNEVCVRALAHLRKTQPGVAWTMTFAGGQSVEQWAGLQRYAGELGVRDAVEFLGPVDKTRLADLLNTSLCLVSASRIESFCMVAVEAMAAGCPPVVSNATSMPESVGDAAIIVEPGSHEQFAEAVSALHHDRDAREALIQRGRRHIEKLHIDVFKRNVRTLVTELLTS